MNIKIKVIAYIVRIKNNQKEILVFSHRDFPEAGIQVIGGTVDNDEDHKLALLREIKEESGLIFSLFEIQSKLGVTEYERKDRPELNRRNYYLLNGENLADSWSHIVQSTGEDNGLVFDIFWMNLAQAKEHLTGNFSELFPQVQ